MNRSAVVLVEFQRQWTDPGLYNRLIRKQLNTRDVLDNTRRLAHAARANGVAVLHVPLIIDPAAKQGWFGHLTLGKVFTKGSSRAEFTDGLLDEGDLIALGRTGFDAFAGSELEDIVRAEKISRLYFCGITTEYCVAMSMRTANAFGFESFLVSDCTATRNDRIQQRIEMEFSPNAMQSSELIDSFELPVDANDQPKATGSSS